MKKFPLIILIIPHQTGSGNGCEAFYKHIGDFVKTSSPID